MANVFVRVIFWISLALLFNIYIYFSRGSEPAVNFFTAYLIELSLSVDNLFVFIMIFKYFQTPQLHLQKVLTYGILGAVVMRAIMIFAGIAIIIKFHWMLYLFGLFLIFTALKMWFQKEEKVHPEKNLVLRLVKLFIPISNDYHDG